MNDRNNFLNPAIVSRVLSFAQSAVWLGYGLYLNNTAFNHDGVRGELPSYLFFLSFLLLSGSVSIAGIIFGAIAISRGHKDKLGRSLFYHIAALVILIIAIIVGLVNS